MTFQELINKNYVGKILVSSEHVSESEPIIYDACGNDLPMKEYSPFGREIIEANVAGDEDGDSGIHLWFDHWIDPFFFRDYDDLILH